MRAFTLDGFDTQPALRDDIPAPPVADNEVLVRVHASSVNPVDAFIAAGALKEMLEHSSARTRIEQDFDPEAVRQMKASAEREISVGGPELAAQAIRAGLVDEYELFVTPVVVGGGKQSLPDSVRMKLELLDQRRFRSGMVYLRYRAIT